MASLANLLLTAQADAALQPYEVVCGNCPAITVAEINEAARTVEALKKQLEDYNRLLTEYTKQLETVTRLRLRQ
jgi:hypothetical protein